MISDPPSPTWLRRDRSVIGDQLEAAAFVEASADAQLLRNPSRAGRRDLPLSDYSEMLKLARCPLSLAATLGSFYVDHSHGPVLAPAT